jgi:Type I phosphodiesterase / nucleotide pyrophosphatase
MRSLMTQLAALTGVMLTVGVAVAQDRPPNNVILFVPDGLRALSVTPESAPTMADIRDTGVNFKNSHSVFPTFTTANASAMATGHQLGDTGDFSNTIYTVRPIPGADNSVTPFLENNRVLGEVDLLFGGDYLNEETILKAARGRGFSTAAIGKLGPVLIFDHTERSGGQTIVVDDSTGTATGIALSDEFKAALTAAGLPLATPGRGDNGRGGDFKTPGTTVANVVQQGYFADVAAKVLLPMFKARNRPFVLVYWSRDPDGTQHAQGDSLNEVTPGINGPTSLAAIKNADDNLKRLRDALGELGLAETTNIIIAADHGFSTVSKQSETSIAAKASYTDVPAGFLPPGFMSIDIAKGLGLPLYDPDSQNAPVGDNAHPRLRGNGLIGRDPARPDVVVAANGGSDLIYLPNKDRLLAKRVIDILRVQDYVSGFFVDDDLGPYPGTLPLSAISLRGKSVTPRPAIVVNFRSFSTGCDEPILCAATVADATQQQGQGMHGSFSRADTMNFMAAAGPDFKTAFVDTAPVSNADVGVTIARILGLRIRSKGTLVGRLMREAMPGGRMPTVGTRTRRSEPDQNGLRTLLNYQRVGPTRYFDAAGFPGRTVGLKENTSTASR